jgi:hypothetical protein
VWFYLVSVETVEILAAVSDDHNFKMRTAETAAEPKISI